nr:MAG TPA: hypothetical protein [Bacteriophage sp.]
MARKMYHVKRQFQGQEPEVLSSSTRKYDAEKYLNRLFKNYKASKGTTVYWVREGYFKVEVVLPEIFTTEYWIEKY